MSETLRQVQALLAQGIVRVSLHGYEELSADNISARDVVEGVAAADAVEDYPDHPRGPCVLVLEWDREGRPVHVVWGIPAGQESPAVIVTAYRPGPERWDESWLQTRA